MKHWVFFMALIVIFFTSCVTSKRYNELDALKNKLIHENDSMRAQCLSLEGALADASAENVLLRNQRAGLIEDTTQMGTRMRYLTGKNKELNELNVLLEKNYKNLLAGSETETKRILSELRDAQAALQKREDELNMIQHTLEEKSRRLEELERKLAEKDAQVQLLKNKVMEALKGFKDSGLTVEVKNGKVYVSMSEKLLFASGSTEVDQKGKDALRELAKVLEKEPDINVMIEGHTDNVPLRGTGCNKDNWDLSVTRATAVTRILLASARIEPSRITASGRGEFMPLVNNDTPDNKARNRRTEIILTPKLDELFKIIESN
ncbi:MAG: OmpA family protein [Candidatus Competibacteraceae bacterium]|nr:OmpA family protein [Candidatus Competibacteraceae bacterium]